MSDKATLDELRAEFDYATREWDGIRKDGKKDVLCAAGQVWEALDPDGLDAREKAKRPHLSLDELGQYLNQLVNEVRSAKRGIRVTPTGNGADDAKATFYQDLIRQIEYKSNAQQAYTTMFDSCVHRGYGFLRINTRYVEESLEEPGPQSFDQEVLIEPVPNPDLVTPDPDALRPDLSDMNYLWVRESWTHEEFNRRFPGAEVKSFKGNTLTEAGPQWATEHRVMVGERWKIETKPRQLVLLPGPDDANPTQGAMAVWKDTIPKAEWEKLKGSIVNEREVQDRYVCQYLTNGLEILKKQDWKGKHIPFVGCLGKILWVDEGEGSKRKIMSLIRLARDPFLFYCYINTCIAEAIGGVPRSSWVGYEGQFAKPERWQAANHEPIAFLEAKANTQATGQAALPLPQRQPWDPPISNLMVAREGARQSIQAAMGSGFLPTEAQKRNEKSGVALRQIESSAQKGSYHFIDHYDDAIRRTGEIIVDLIPHIYDTARDIHVRTATDEPIPVRINDPQAVDNRYKAPISTDEGDYDVTISVGPSFESERQAQNEFVDTLVGGPTLEVVANLGGPKVALGLMAKAIKMKALGPIADDIADMLMPPEMKQDGEQMPAEAMAQMQQAQQMIEAAQQRIQELEQELATDAIKAQRDVELAKIKGELDAMKIKLQGVIDLKLQDDQQAHELAMAAADAGQAETDARRAEMMQIATMPDPMDKPPQGPQKGEQ
jgi:hypothetical protein